jgi:hypothetical protein
MVRNFIKALGGPWKVAAELNALGFEITGKNVQVWSHREIPAKWRPKIARLAQRHRIKEDIPNELEEFMPVRRARRKAA